MIASFGLLSCGSSSPSNQPPSKQSSRIFASQSVSSLTSQPGLVVVDGDLDTLARAPHISAGTSPGYMQLSPQRSIAMVFDVASNSIDVINTQTETESGTVALPGATTSMVVTSESIGYVAVPSAPIIGLPSGALVALNLSNDFVSATISVPSAQTVVSNSGGSQLLVFSNDSNSVTLVSPLQLNTGAPVTTTIAGFDRPVYAVFSSDGTTAYVLNCGPQCGGTLASVQPLNMSTLVPGTPLPVDAATIALLNGSTLYVAGTPAANNACSGQATAAKTCGRLDIIDLGSMTVTGRVVITDGYHDRIDLSTNNQLFIGSHTCTNIGNVNAVTPAGEIRGCLSIFDTTISGNNSAIIPPDNGDVTGLQTISRPIQNNVGSQYVEYVAEGGNLRVYNTLTDSLLIDLYVETGTITVTGQVTDVKAVDFF